MDYLDVASRDLFCHICLLKQQNTMQLFLEALFEFSNLQVFEVLHCELHFNIIYYQYIILTMIFYQQ